MLLKAGDNGKVNFKASSAEIGVFSRDCECQRKGFDGGQLAFNKVYLRDAIAPFPKGATVHMGINAASSPVIFTSEQAPDALMLVMPILIVDLAAMGGEEYEELAEEEGVEQVSGIAPGYNVCPDGPASEKFQQATA